MNIEYQSEKNIEEHTESLEISTKLLIEAAKKRNIQVTMLNRKENLIQLSQDGKIEYIKQATKTRLDSYLSFSLMENKYLTRLLLEKKGLSIPKGIYINSRKKADSFLTEKFSTRKDQRDFFYLREMKAGRLVIKPVSSEFGSGISFLNELSTYEEWKKAFDISFSYSEEILIEEFISGQEYRFIVLGEKCRAVCKRIPANIIGDGFSSIEKLVQKKNDDPQRGKGHTSPVEKIQIGEIELAHLTTKKYTLKSIPPQGEQTFLRTNSNVSTGGESIDCTDEIPKDYQEIAELAAKSVGANLCGVDIILQDTRAAAKEKKYAILEVNFNPAIYIHEVPFQGKSRPLSNQILDLLGFTTFATP